MGNELINKLEDVIREALSAQGGEGLLTEWVIVTASRGYEDDGRCFTEIGTIVPADMPAHHAVGLMSLARQEGE